MARLLSQTLIRISASSSSPTKSPSLSLSSRIFSHRNRSNKSGKAQLIEVDLESEGEVEVLGIRKLEDVIHSIIVRRSAPDWLPFVPGSSYWVPPKPRRPYNVVELLGKLTNPLNEDESLSLTTVRGWPSSTYFIEDPSLHETRRLAFSESLEVGSSTSTHPVPIEVEVEVDAKVQSNLENESRSEDEG